MGRIGRKALVFSLLAIAMSGLFLLAYAPRWGSIADHSTELDKVDSINNDIELFASYAESALQVSGVSALDSMYNRINSSNNFYDDFSEGFLDCITENSCVQENNLRTLLQLQRDILRQKYQNSWSVIFSPLPQHRNVTVHRWDIEVSLVLIITVEDDVASWRTSLPITTKIDIEGVYDPAYVFINNFYGGTAQRRFVRDDSSQLGFSSFTKWYGAESYRASPDGLCISHRFEGDFNAQGGDCGLISLARPSQHPRLLTDGLGLTHLDTRLLRGELYDCLPSSTNPGRVGICDLDQNLTLSIDDALLFNLSTHWCGVNGSTTAYGCS